MAVKTCGVFLVSKEHKILACHPTKQTIQNWSIPKGKKEEGESNLEAALRETKEEANVDLFQKGELNVVTSRPILYRNKKKILVPFIIKETENSHLDFSEFELKCNEYVNGNYPEVDQYRWFTLEEAIEYLHYTQSEVVKKIKDFI